MNKEEEKILLETFRHDRHKTVGRSHRDSEDPDVMFGADDFAGSLSRPSPPPTGKRRERLENRGDTSHYRISLLTRNSLHNFDAINLQNLEDEIDELFGGIKMYNRRNKTEEDLERVQGRWLNDYLPALFNETFFYPYTSLKYHTLLTAALVNTRLNDNEFSNLYLHLYPYNRDTEPDHYTIYRSPSTGPTLKLAPLRHGDSLGTAKLPTNSQEGWMGFGDTWSRLTSIENVEPHLDAVLRGRRSWSTALQLMEDVERFGWNTKNQSRKSGIV